MNFIFLLLTFAFAKPSVLDWRHPIYVSVIDINHNRKDQTLEISSKFFIEDMEKNLRATTKAKIDLYNKDATEKMGKFLNQYMQKHFFIVADNEKVELSFLGFELLDDEIYIYYEAPIKKEIKSILVKSNALYEYSHHQSCYVNYQDGNIKRSKKITNPESKVQFDF